MQATNLSRRTVLAGAGALAATAALPALAAVAPRAWAFEIGQKVDHEEGRFPAVVLARHWTGKREVYGVELLDGECAGEPRVMSGEVLVAL